jgi:hypothetical protein
MQTRRCIGIDLHRNNFLLRATGERSELLERVKTGGPGAVREEAAAER